MSQSGDGADATIVAAHVATVPPVVNTGAAGSSYNPFSESRPPSIHDAASIDESSSSDEDEGKMSEARRRRKEKMKRKDREEGEEIDEENNHGRKGEAPFLRHASSASQL